MDSCAGDLPDDSPGVNWFKIFWEQKILYLQLFIDHTFYGIIFPEF